MKISPALKSYLIETFKLAADVSEADLKKCVAEKIAAGELAPEKLVELAGEKSAAEKLNGLIKSQVDAAIAPVATAIESLAKALTGKTEEKAKTSDKNDADPITGIDDEDEDSHSKSIDADELEALIEKRVEAALGGRVSHSRNINPVKLLGRGSNPRVKSVAEQYSNTKSALVVPLADKKGNPNRHPQAGRTLVVNGHEQKDLSELEKAVCGAWLKSRYLATLPAGCDDIVAPGMRMTEHDKHLLAYGANEMAWTVTENANSEMEVAKDYRRLSDRFGEKATLLLDDATSDGLEIAPIVFDDAVVVIPLLFGEIAPLVEQVTLPRGRRIEGASMNTPTYGSGTDEGTNINLETTDAFIQEMNSNIFVSSGAVEIGMDFLEDSPVQVFELLSQGFGEARMEWMDNQIVNGDGSTEPLGFLNMVGAIAIDSALGVNGPAAVGDLEGLLLGLPKAVKAKRGGRNVYIGTESAYQVARSIPVGNNDARRVFGMDHDTYSVFQRPFKVQNDMPDTSLLYVAAGWYKWWRRKGFSIRVETGGKTLARTNTLLMVARGRDGGRPLLGSAVAKMTDFASA